MAKNIRTTYKVDDGFIGTVAEIADYLGVSKELVKRDIRKHYRCKGHYITLDKRVKISQIYAIYDFKYKITMQEGDMEHIFNAFYGNYTKAYLRLAASKHLVVSEDFYINPTGRYKETILKKGDE